MAILEYLDEIVPEPPILPRDPYGRARAREIAHVVACDIHPVNNLRVGRYLKRTLNVARTTSRSGSATGSRSASMHSKRC